MIQRIQTVYLLVIVMLSATVLFAPLADLINTTEKLIYLLDFKGFTQIQTTGSTIVSSVWGLNTISAIVPVLAVITIFLYKNRQRQIRLSVINMVFMILFYAFLAYYIWSGVSNLHAEWHLRTAVILPIVNIILNYLAIGAIRKDEKLVRSLDRLR